MVGSMIGSRGFVSFLIASLILAVTPGPAVVYLVTRTLSAGRRAGIVSIAGIALGSAVNAVAASVGMAAVFAASARAFVVVKLAGGAYLMYLGLSTLLSRSPPRDNPAERARPARTLRDAFLVAALNPKTALFFAALLPQFIRSGVPPLPQSLALSGVFIAIAVCTDLLYVLSASSLAAAVGRGTTLRPVGRYVSAASFIGLGIYAMLVDRPSATPPAAAP